MMLRNDEAWLVLGAIVLASLLALLQSSGKGPSLCAGTVARLKRLNLTADIMARSLALGFTIGTMPVYIPTLPTFISGGVARLTKLSVPAAVIGSYLPVPILILTLTFFIRVGEWITNAERLEVNRLLETMSDDMVGAFREFGGRLLWGSVVWAISSPVMFYFVSVTFLALLSALERSAPTGRVLQWFRWDAVDVGSRVEACEEPAAVVGNPSVAAVAAECSALSNINEDTSITEDTECVDVESGLCQAPETALEVN